MEVLRNEKRDEIAEVRFQKRSLLRDHARHIDKRCLAADIGSEQEMKKSAKLLSQKSSVSPELLIAIKNSLLQNSNLIDSFMEVDTALPALLRIFSSNDARLQLLAGHCLCNLALGDEKVCLRLAKSAGSYLVMRMEGMSPLLSEASVWTIGNISSFRKAAEILHAQGAYSHAAKLLASSTDDAVRCSATYCLIHAIKNNNDLFSNEDYIQLVTHCLAINKPDSLIFCLISILSHNANAAELMAQKGLHVEVLSRLDKDAESVEKDVSLSLSLIRILGNMVAESTGQVARQVLLSPNLPNTAQRLLHLTDSPISRETTWFLANMACHQNPEIRVVCSNLDIVSWFPTV